MVRPVGLRANALCSLGIVGVIAGIAFGLPAIDRALPPDRVVAAGVRYPVTDTVTVLPPAGARLDVRQTRPGRDSGYVLFRLGTVRYAVVVSHEQLRLPDAADRLRTRL